MEYSQKTATEWMVNNGLQHFMTGSREICNPPVMDTDVDFVILNLGSPTLIEDDGWVETTGSDESYDHQLNFRTFRSGEVNLIVVDNYVDFTKWRVATAAAKALNLRDKQARIALFQGVLYDNWGN